MEFGLLVRNRRQELGMETRVLEKKSGINHGTISRIENGQVHILVITAIQLCKALSLDPIEIIDPERKNERTLLIPHTKSKAYLHNSDLNSLSQLFSIKPLSILDKLIEITGKFSTSDTQAEFCVDEYWKKRAMDQKNDRLSGLLEILQAVKYPKKTDNALIMNINMSGGVISLLDFGHFMRNIRKGRSLTLAEVQELSRLSDSTLCNFERGNIQRVKLSDILILDKVLKAKGDLFHLIWDVCEFQQRVVDDKFLCGWSINERIVRNYAICVYRWLQFHADGSDEKWLSGLRKMVEARNNPNLNIIFDAP